MATRNNLITGKITKRINVFTDGLPENSENANTSAYGVETGHSVKIPVPKIREGLATDEALRKQSADFTSDQQRQDKALADFKTEYTTKQTEQDGKIAQVEQSISKAHYVPYSGNLDEIPTSEREGKIFHYWGSSADYQRGYFYEWIVGADIVIPPHTRYMLNQEQNEFPKGYYINTATSELRISISKSSDGLYLAPLINIIQIGDIVVEDKSPHNRYSVTAIDGYTLTLSNGYSGTFTRESTSNSQLIYEGYGLSLYYDDSGWNFGIFVEFRNGIGVPTFRGGNFDNQSGFVRLGNNKDTELIIEGEKIWRQVHVDSQFDPSAISADISAEVQRATQAESALSTRIDTKADTSTWSANLKQQIDTDHTALGTLSGYLTSAKQTDINNAISKAHQQNTDTKLANGVVSVESDKVTFSRPVVANEVQAGSAPNAHLLTKKLDSAMLRTYNSFADMVADKANNNIPQGAWCAIIE